MAETTTLQQDIAKYDQSNDTTNAIRMRIIDKLMIAVDDAQFDPKELNSEGLEARMSMVNSVAGLLNDVDKSTAQRVGIKQKNKDSDSEAAFQTQTVAVLQQFARRKMGSAPPLPGAEMSPEEMEAAQTEMATAFAASGQTILDTELRERPDDLT